VQKQQKVKGLTKQGRSHMGHQKEKEENNKGKDCNVAMEIRLASPQDFGLMNTHVVLEK